MRHATCARAEDVIDQASRVARFDNRGRRYVVKQDDGYFVCSEWNDSTAEEGQTLYAECFPGGRVVLWGEAGA